MANQDLVAVVTKRDKRREKKNVKTPILKYHI